jgi:hypothetical protein
MCTKMYLKGLVTESILRTASLHEMINLFKNGQSLDLLVSPLKPSSHDFVDHVAHGFKTKEKMQPIVRV